jgi:hypothetical protein
VQTPGGRLLRRSAHEEDRPALFAAQFALSHACWLVTYLVAGVVGNEIGLFWTFGLLGLLVVVSTGLAVRLWPSADPLSSSTSTGPRSTSTCTHMTSITSIHTRVGKARSRTATRIGMLP